MSDMQNLWNRFDTWAKQPYTITKVDALIAFLLLLTV